MLDMAGIFLIAFLEKKGAQDGWGVLIFYVFRVGEGGEAEQAAVGVNGEDGILGAGFCLGGIAGDRKSVV